MAGDEQRIECVIEAQANGLSEYIENLAELKNALSEIIALEDNGAIKMMRLQRVSAEMERQIDSSRRILDALEQLKWQVIPLAPPPSLY